MVRTRTRKSSTDGDGPRLRHVLVVGGTVAEWDDLGPGLWAARRNELAKAVAHAGGTWLTIRPFELGVVSRDASRSGREWVTEHVVEVHEGCTIIVDPSPDGRERLLAAIRHLGTDGGRHHVDEEAVSGVLMAPAPREPDLTIVLGPVTRLPPSLVWELAYSEIVFLDIAWNELAAAHVERAADEFSRRHRRFGGIV